MDCSPPGSSVHGILQARILEWGAISFPRGSSRPRDRTQVSHTAGRRFTSEPPGKPNVGNLGSVPGWGRSPGEGNGYLLQYSCLENPMDGGQPCGYSPWGRTELTQLSTHGACIYWASRVALVVKDPRTTGDHSYFLVSSIAPINLPK